MKRATSDGTPEKRAKLPVLRVGLPLLLLGIIMSFLAGTASMAIGAGGDITWHGGDVQSGKQQATASIVDRNGDIIITGYRNLSGGADDDYLTVKFKGDGTGVAWRAFYDKAGNSDQATAITTDSHNDIIVTGYVWNGSNRDIHTIKYNGLTGDVIWQHTFNGASSGNDTGTAIAVDASDNVYVGGNSQNGSSNDDIVILKYGPDGPGADGNPLWTARYNGPLNGHDQLSSITAGPGGIAATGQSYGSGRYRMLTLLYDYSGNLTWEREYTPAGNARGKVVRFDGSGNIVATGSAGNGTDLDIYTVKYDGSGTFLWGRTYAAAYDDEPYAMDIDGSGEVYVTGYTWTLTGFNDFYTARYNGSTGDVVWEALFDSGNDNADLAIATSISVVPSGDLFVTGYTVAAGNSDFRTIKYKRANGNELWQRSFNALGGGNDRPVGLGIDQAGQVLVSGWSDNGTDLDYYVVKYDPGAIDPPTGLSASTLPDRSIRLSWADNSWNEEGFTVERKEGETGTYLPIITPGLSGTVGPDTVTYTDADPTLKPDTTYYYRVKAISAVTGDSHYSNEVLAVTVYVNFVTPAIRFLQDSPDHQEDYAQAIAVGLDNDPVVTGYSQRTTGGFDYLSVKLDRGTLAAKWTDLYDDADGELDKATCVAVDQRNYAVVSGFSSLYSSTARRNINSIFTIGYRADSPVVDPPVKAWTAKYNGPGAIDDRATAIATTIDSANNVVVIGYGKNAASNDDIYVIKYRSDGTQAWAATPFDAGADDIPSAVTIGQDGSVYVTGYSETAPGTSRYNFFTAKYDGQTGARIWADIYSPTAGGDNRGNALALDAAGDLYVTGFATNAAGDRDYYTIKYSGTAGSPTRIWQHPFDGPAHGDDAAVGVKVDPIDGTIVVAGTSLTRQDDNDVTLIRYRADGSTVTGWPRTLLRPATDDHATAMAMDPSGYIYLAGNSSNGDTTDIFSLVYSYDGDVLHSSNFNGSANSFDEATAIAVNYRGEAFIAGYSTNASGNADYLVFRQANDHILVPAPFTLVPRSDADTIELYWTGNTTGATFNISRTTSPVTAESVWTNVATNLPAGTSSHNDSGLDPGISYCYRIVAVNGGVNSRGPIACASTTLTAPTLNPVTVVSSSDVDLTWNTMAGNTGYKVERQSGGGAWAQVGGNLLPGTTSFRDSGLTAGTVYYYRVSALNAGGASQPSQVQVLPVLNGPSGVTSAKIDLSWPAVSGATGYILERSPDNSTWGQLATPGAGQLNHSDNTVASATTYYYRLRSVTAAGTSGASLVTSAVTKLKTPAMSTASATSTTAIGLTWTDPNGGASVNESGVSLEYAACINSSPNDCLVSNDSVWGAWTSVAYDANTVSGTREGLESGRSYRFRVKTTLSGADSDPSAPLVATTNLTAPTGLASSNVTSSGVQLSWNNILGENNFKVEQNGALLAATIAQNLTHAEITGLGPSGTYTFRIKAYNSTSYAFSDPVTVTTLAAGPQLTAATPVSQTEVDVAWSAIPGILKYEIWRGRNGPTGLIASPGPSETTYPDTTLSAGTAYQYAVRAQLADGSFTDFSNVLSATTVPPAPAVLTPTGITPTQIDVSWTSVANATGYTLQHKQRTGADCSTGTWNTVDRPGINSITWSATGLTVGAAYCFQVSAYNQAGASPYGTPVTMLPAPVLDAPGGITSSQVVLTWGATVPGNAGYAIERSSDNVTFGQIGTVGVDILTYTDSTAAANTTYYYRVRTIFDSLKSVPSNTQSATTLFAQAPTLDSLSGVTTSQVVLNWTTVAGNIGYLVERSVDNTTWTSITTTAQNAVSYPNTGLTPGTLYYYRIKTKFSANSFSSSSNVLSATTTPAFPVPPTGKTNVSLAIGSEARVDLTWQVVHGATNYKVMRSIGESGPWTEVANLAIPYTTLYCGTQTSPTIGCPTLVPVYTTYPDAGLTANTRYCYQLKAWNSTGGDSAPSDTPPVCMKTPAVGGPNLSAALAVSSMAIQLYWDYSASSCSPNPCAAPDGFEVWRKSWNGRFVPWKKVYTASYVDNTNIEPQKTYVYQVRALYGNDASPFSNTASVTVPAYTAGDGTCVSNPNAPVITSVAPATVTEGAAYTYQVVATGQGGFSYSLPSGPGGMTISSSGVITWAPTHSDIGTSTVTMRVIDGGGRLVEQTFAVTVLRINTAPVVTSTPPATGQAGVEYSYQVVASDGDNDPLTYSLASPPAGMTISSSGLISWVPAGNQTGSRSVSVRVSDGFTYTPHNFVIEVAASQPPVISSTAPVNATEGVAYSYPVVATDPNSLSLTYSLSGAPAGMTISPAGVISWTPDLYQAERTNPTVTVTVRNTNNLSAVQTFTIAVADFPRPPQVTSTAPVACAMGSQYSYQIAATDPDGLPLTYELPLNGFPAGLTVSSTGLVTWTPTSGQMGTFPVTVRIKDANVFTDHTFTILVADAPTAPTVNATGDIDTGCGGTASVTLSWNAASAPEGHGLEYSVSIDGGAPTAWQSGTTYTFSTYGGHSWRVKAKDIVTTIESGWSATGSFRDYQSCGGSCPDLYAWDGSRFVFESDLYGSGKLGTAITGGYLKPNPNDYYLLRTMPAPNAEGNLEVRLVEDRWETDYLDAVHLYTIDMPADRDLYAEIPILGGGYRPVASMVHTVSRNLQAPVSMVHVNNGQDISPVLAASDKNYLILSEDRDLFDWHTIELDLGNLSGASGIKLVIDAQSVFPSTSTARLGQLAINGQRTLIQVLDANGNWVTVPKEVLQLPIPKEFRRPFVLDISRIFQSGVFKVRLSFLFKTYVDSIRLDTTADLPVTITEAPLTGANLGYNGTTERDSTAELYGYEYGRIADYGYGYMPGSYTRYGNVEALLSSVDDKFALFGTGDQLRLVFQQPAPVSDGMSRRFLLYTNGYYKAYNNKSIPRTVDPLPFAAMTNFPYSAPEAYPTDDEHNQYRLQYNTRQVAP